MVVVVTRHSLNIVDIDTNEWEFGDRHESYLIINIHFGNDCQTTCIATCTLD